jgi:hypothetical protein
MTPTEQPTEQLDLAWRLQTFEQAFQKIDECERRLQELLEIEAKITDGSKLPDRYFHSIEESIQQLRIFVADHCQRYSPNVEGNENKEQFIRKLRYMQEKYDPFIHNVFKIQPQTFYGVLIRITGSEECTQEIARGLPDDLLEFSPEKLQATIDLFNIDITQLSLKSIAASLQTLYDSLKNDPKVKFPVGGLFNELKNLRPNDEEQDPSLPLTPENIPSLGVLIYIVISIIILIEFDEGFRKKFNLEFEKMPHIIFKHTRYADINALFQNEPNRSLLSIFNSLDTIARSMIFASPKLIAILTNLKTISEQNPTVPTLYDEYRFMCPDVMGYFVKRQWILDEKGQPKEPFARFSENWPMSFYEAVFLLQSWLDNSGKRRYGIISSFPGRETKLYF